MRFKFTLILLLANLVVFFALWRLERTVPQITKPSGLIDFAVDHLTITDHVNNEVRELVRDNDGNWRIEQPVDWAANNSAVQHIITYLLQPDEQSHFAPDETDKSADPLAQYGLDKPRFEITVGGPGGRKVSLLVGKSTLAGNNLYVMNPADHLVRVWTDDFLTNGVALPLKDLRDNHVFTIGVFEVQGLSIWSLNAGAASAGSPNLGTPNLVHFRTVAQDHSQWQLDTPLLRPANSQAVNIVLQQLVNLSVADFLTPAEVNQAQPGLANPTLSVELQGENNSQKLLIGAAVPNATAPQYYAKRQNSDVVFTVNAGEPFDTLRQALEKLRERQFMNFALDAVSGITVHALDGNELRMLRSEGGDNVWNIQLKDPATGTPTTWPADSDMLHTLLTSLQNLSAKNFTTDAPHDLASYGLEKPIWKVTLQINKSATEKTTLTLSIGRSADTPYRYYAKTDTSDSVYEIDGDIVRELSAEPLRYRDRTFETLPKSAQIVSIKMTRLKDDQSDDGSPVFNYTADAGKSLEDQLKVETPSAEHENILALCNWLRRVSVDAYLKASFDVHTPVALFLNNSTVPTMVPWRYRLDVALLTPAVGQTPAQNQSLTFYFTENFGGLQAGGASAPQQVVFLVPISVVTLLNALIGPKALPPAASQTLQDMTQPIDARATPAAAAGTAPNPAPSPTPAPSANTTPPSGTPATAPGGATAPATATAP